MGKTSLKRSLSLSHVTFYGLGTILGAGIYVLIGKVVGLSGIYAPFSFLLAAIVAAFTGFSYAELSSRFPKSAGEAVYIYEATHSRFFSAFIGWMVVAVGIVSSAAIAIGFVGYLKIFVEIPSWLSITILVLSLCVLACWGIKESVMAATVITILEVFGLLLVIFVGSDSLVNIGDKISGAMLIPESGAISGIVLGAFLAFYAFIGFEDMVNVAEEVKNPRQTLPTAIILAVVISTILYFLVSIVAVLSMPVDKLASSDAPLAAILESKGYSPGLISIISLFAVINGALIQIIMASRIFYGLAKAGNAPKLLADINPLTRTPIKATVLVSAVILILALWLPIVSLAQTTSLVTLLIFTAVNISLIIIKKTKGPYKGQISYPVTLPYMATMLCLAMIGFQLFS